MPTVTLAQLRGRIYAGLDDNTLLYTTAEVNAMVNECLRILNCFTGLLQTTSYLISQTDRIWYDVPAGIVVPLRVQFEGQYLQKMFPNEIGMAYATWTQDTTSNIGLPVSEWVPCGFTKFGIHPADALGGGQIAITGLQEPTQLVNDGDVVALPNEFTDALVTAATATLQLKESAALFKGASLMINKYFSTLKRITLWRGFTQPRYFVPELVQKK